jgi:hypothetical protein
VYSSESCDNSRGMGDRKADHADNGAMERRLLIQIAKELPGRDRALLVALARHLLMLRNSKRTR